MTDQQQNNTIAIDAMGSDMGPEEILEGVALAQKHRSAAGNVILVGQQEKLVSLLKKTGLDKDSRVSILHASQVIGMDEKPVQSLKSKKDASMVRAIELLKENKAQGVLSCGNTGSLMACGTIKLRAMKGLERPALAGIVPGKDNRIIIDVGANPQPEPRHLVHNAILGAEYARAVLGRKNPTVGLLTIGTEEGKGNNLVNETHELLKKVEKPLNYKGLVEGFSIFKASVDVIVCDGFVGNVAIKSCESFYSTIKGLVKDEIMKSWVAKLGALLTRKAFKSVKDYTNPERFGGAPLLGLNGLVLKAHGSSNRTAILHAIRIGRQALEHDIQNRIQLKAEEINALIAPEKVEQPC